jgi:hypothetical protein
MTKEARGRSAARIDRMVAVPAAAGVLFWLKGAAIAAGIGVVGVVTVTRVVPLFSPVAAHVPAPSGVPGLARSVVDIPAPPPLSTATAKTSLTPTPTPTPTSPPTPTPTPSVETDVLAREAALLEKARRELEHDPTLALTTLDGYAVEFPNGTLGMEKELLAVDALTRVGRIADARARGKSLLGRARGSIYEERVKRMVEALDSK